MKKLKIVLVLVLIICTISFILGQEKEEMPESIKRQLKVASYESSVMLDETANEFIFQLYIHSTDDIKKSLNSSRYELIEQQIKKYLQIKRRILNKHILSKRDVIDFNWDEMSQDVDLVLVKIIPPSNSQISLITTGNGALSIKTSIFLEDKKENIIIVPAKGTFSINAVTHNKPFVLSGTSDLSSDTFKFFPIITQGCEVYVNSDPPEATIYFNGKKYYKPTNTSSARYSEKLKVIIKKDRYKDWEEEKELKNGETWTINAKLIEITRTSKPDKGPRYIIESK